jgi:L-cystine uptake protein TcyP (sodium:dicarboxylate symporter family)
MRIVHRNLQTRSIALLVVTGLVVSWIAHGLDTHWKSFPSWRVFFGSWLIHTLGIVILVAVVGGAIVRFFLGLEHNGDHAKLTFYVVMTVLVSAICIAIIAKGTPSAWELCRSCHSANRHHQAASVEMAKAFSDASVMMSALALAMSSSAVTSSALLRSPIRDRWVRGPQYKNLLLFFQCGLRRGASAAGRGGSR